MDPLIFPGQSLGGPLDQEEDLMVLSSLQEAEKESSWEGSKVKEELKVFVASALASDLEVALAFA